MAIHPTLLSLLSKQISAQNSGQPMKRFSSCYIFLLFFLFVFRCVIFALRGIRLRVSSTPHLRWQCAMFFSHANNKLLQMFLHTVTYHLLKSAKMPKTSNQTKNTRGSPCNKFTHLVEHCFSLFHKTGLCPFPKRVSRTMRKRGTRSAARFWRFETIAQCV